MEEIKSNTMSKNAMNYGAIVGIALVIFNLLTYVAGVSTSKNVSYLSFLIIILGIFFCIKHYRDKILGGGINYGKSLGMGTLICLYSGIIYGFFTYILLKFIDPGLIDKILAMVEENLVKSGMPDDKVEMAMNMQKKFATPLFYAFSEVFSLTFYGFIFSLILSIFLRKEVTPFAYNDEKAQNHIEGAEFIKDEPELPEENNTTDNKENSNATSGE